jgi:hypothetical protein
MIRVLIWPEYDLNKAKTYLYTCMSYFKRNLADNRLPIQIHKTGYQTIVQSKRQTRRIQ